MRSTLSTKPCLKIELLKRNRFGYSIRCDETLGVCVCGVYYKTENVVRYWARLAS